MFPIAPPFTQLDSRVEFVEKGHRYRIDGADAIGTTTWLKTYFEPFRAKRVAEQKAGSGKYASMPTAESVLAFWDNKGAMGTQMHARIERTLTQNLPVDPTDIELKQCLGLLRGWAPRIKAMSCEKRILDPDALVAGTVDFIAWTSVETRCGFLVDWKRVDTLWPTGFNGKMGIRAPCLDLPDCNSTHYALQLMIYRYILEINYKATISSIFLALFHPDFQRFRLVNAEGLVDRGRERVEEMFRQRYASIVLKGGVKRKSLQELPSRHHHRASSVAQASQSPVVDPLLSPPSSSHIAPSAEVSSVPAPPVMPGCSASGDNTGNTA